ncbi:unnamed protein product [Brugia timori]|uniref:Uncharacterized protein n=1 Tax=Brugia timori TaxID=42155 RepID=A0A0R3R1J6_9BILA|nr:unnamed protein product [Brugia timori]
MKKYANVKYIYINISSHHRSTQTCAHIFINIITYGNCWHSFH